MKHKKLTLIELIITILVLGLLAALAIPQFTGVKANADVASFKNDIDTLSKAMDESYIKDDSLPLGEKVIITDTELLDTIYATGDSGTNLYKIDLTKSSKYHSKLKSKIDADSYFIYSMETGKVFYTKPVIDGDGQTLYTMEYIGLSNIVLGSTPLISGMSVPVTEPVQTITGEVPATATVEVSVNGTNLPVTMEDVVFEGKMDLLAGVKMKTFTAQATLSNGTNTVTVKVDSQVTNFKINLGEGTTPVVPEDPKPITKPTAVISMTPEQGLTTTTNISWSHVNSTVAEGRTITAAEWEGKQDIYANTGSYTVRLRVQDSTGVWSEWTEKTFEVFSKPIAVITLTPENNLTTSTNIIWSYSNSIISGNSSIADAQWEGKQDTYGAEGFYTVRLKVKDSNEIWSDWAEKTIKISFPATLTKMYIDKYSMLVEASSCYAADRGISTIFDDELNTSWMANKMSGSIVFTLDNPKVVESIYFSSSTNQYMNVSFYDASNNLLLSNYVSVNGGNVAGGYGAYSKTYLTSLTTPVKKIVISAPNSNGALNYFFMNDIRFVLK